MENPTVILKMRNKCKANCIYELWVPNSVDQFYLIYHKDNDTWAVENHGFEGKASNSLNSKQMYTDSCLTVNVHIPTAYFISQSNIPCHTEYNVMGVPSPTLTTYKSQLETSTTLIQLRYPNNLQPNQDDVAFYISALSRERAVLFGMLTYQKRISLPMFISANTQSFFKNHEDAVFGELYLDVTRSIVCNNLPPYIVSSLKDLHDSVIKPEMDLFDSFTFKNDGIGKLLKNAWPSPPSIALPGWWFPADRWAGLTAQSHWYWNNSRPAFESLWLQTRLQEICHSHKISFQAFIDDLDKGHHIGRIQAVIIRCLRMHATTRCYIPDFQLDKNDIIVSTDFYESGGGNPGDCEDSASIGYQIAMTILFFRGYDNELKYLPRLRKYLVELGLPIGVMGTAHNPHNDDHEISDPHMYFGLLRIDVFKQWFNLPNLDFKQLFDADLPDPSKNCAFLPVETTYPTSTHLMHCYQSDIFDKTHNLFESKYDQYFGSFCSRHARKTQHVGCNSTTESFAQMLMFRVWTVAHFKLSSPDQQKYCASFVLKHINGECGGILPDVLDRPNEFSLFKTGTGMTKNLFLKEQRLVENFVRPIVPLQAEAKNEFHAFDHVENDDKIRQWLNTSMSYTNKTNSQVCCVYFYDFSPELYTKIQECIDNLNANRITWWFSKYGWSYCLSIEFQ
jgi:hypothetical protein